jgi:hypothetical protein
VVCDKCVPRVSFFLRFDCIKIPFPVPHYSVRNGDEALPPSPSHTLGSLAFDSHLVVRAKAPLPQHNRREATSIHATHKLCSNNKKTVCVYSDASFPFISREKIVPSGFDVNDHSAIQASPMHGWARTKESHRRTQIKLHTNMFNRIRTA